MSAAAFHVNVLPRRAVNGRYKVFEEPVYMEVRERRLGRRKETIEMEVAEGVCPPILTCKLTGLLVLAEEDRPLMVRWWRIRQNDKTLNFPEWKPIPGGPIWLAPGDKFQPTVVLHAN